MRNAVLFHIACVLSSGLFAQSAYRIKGQVNGLTADEVYLAYYLGDKQYVKDTVAAKEGSFVFEGDESLDGGIYLVVLPPDNQYFELIIDQDQEFSFSTNTSNIVTEMKIEGSQDNEIFYGDLVFLEDKRKEEEVLKQELSSLIEGSEEYGEVNAKIGKINEEVADHRNKLKTDNPHGLYAALLNSLENPVVPADIQDDQHASWAYYKAHYFDKVDLSDHRLLRTPVLHSKVMTYFDKLTYQTPDSLNATVDEIVDRASGNELTFQYWVVSLLNKFANSKIMGMDAVYVHIAEQYYMTGRATWADPEQIEKITQRALAISPTLVGRVAPNFVAYSADNQGISLHSVQGKFTILYFWDYDCGNCKKITPNLAQSYEKYKDHDVALVTVSINGDHEVWKEKFAEYGLEDAINLQDHLRNSGFDQMYDVRSSPRLFLLGEDKTIIAKQISVETMEEVLNDKLGLVTEVKTED